MNRTQPIEPEQLDRLVDGALSDADRRALLLRIEAEPGGWRRCALAFLEAQCWRDAMAPLVRCELEESNTPSTHDRAGQPGSARFGGWPGAGPRDFGAKAPDRVLADGTPATPKSDIPPPFDLDVVDAPPWDRAGRRRVQTRIGPMVLAASVALVAFLMGWVVGGAGRSGPGPIEETARVAVVEQPPERRDAGIEDAEPVQAAAGEPGSKTEPVDDPAGSTEVRAVGFVRIPMAGGSGATAIEVPVLTGPGLDDQWLRHQPPFVPERWRRRWEDQGYRVEQHRRLVSVQVDNEGRYLTIPVDEVNLEYTTPKTY